MSSSDSAREQLTCQELVTDPDVLDRAQHDLAWEQLSGQEFDVLVIGGGITGAGIALDATTRGLRTALVEARDFASGTSSRSSKLFHGGLRYLEQLNFGLVAEALRERELMLTRLAPHLVRPVSFLYPLTRRAWERPYVATGLTMYDQMGGARSVPRQKHLSRSKALKAFPALKQQALVGAVRYFDGQADDARYTLTVIRTAAHYGALVRSSTEVTGLVRASSAADPDLVDPDRTGAHQVAAGQDEQERVTGVELRDSDTGATTQVRARVVINATGVWSDRLQEMTGASGGFHVRASKGVHLLVPRERIEGQDGLILRTETSVLFVIPWHDCWVIGTTDTDWNLDLAHPAATSTDIDYLLDQVNTVLTDPLDRDDILGVYAGLRPLLSGGDEQTSQLSREHGVDRVVPGFVSIAGGKFTTYRVMAKDAVDAAAVDLGPIPESVTAQTPLLGADGFYAMTNMTHRLAEDLGLSEERIERLLSRYGSLLPQVVAPGRLPGRADLLQPLTFAPGYLRCEIVYACTHEGALHLGDVLVRRTRISIETRDRGTASAPEVADIMAALLGWTPEQREHEIEVYQQRVVAERRSQDLATDPESDAARTAAPEIRSVLAD